MAWPWTLSSSTLCSILKILLAKYLSTPSHSHPNRPFRSKRDNIVSNPSDQEVPFDAQPSLKSIMEQYLDALAFSNDLIVYIGNEIDVPTEDFLCRSDVHTKTSRFNYAIGKAVWGLTKLTNDVKHISEEMGDEIDDGGTEIFAKFAMRAAVDYFPKGYGHCEFIAYCAVVVGSAVRLYQKDAAVGDEMIFEMAAGVIATVLTGHMVVSRFDCSDKVWQELTEVAKKFNAVNDFDH